MNKIEIVTTEDMEKIFSKLSPEEAEFLEAFIKEAFINYDFEYFIDYDFDVEDFVFREHNNVKPLDNDNLHKRRYR